MARPAKSSVLTEINRPVRTCIGCRQRAAKSDLLRVVAGTGPDGRGAVLPDPTATALGRGAHLHPSAECFDQAVRRRAFPRALKSGEGLRADLVAEYLALTDQQ